MNLTMDCITQMVSEEFGSTFSYENINHIESFLVQVLLKSILTGAIMATKCIITNRIRVALISICVTFIDIFADGE